MILIELKLDRPDKVYAPDQTVRVRVELQSPESFLCRCISIRFLGHGEVNFDGFGAKEVYFETNKNLIGQKDGLEIEIPAGSSTYVAEVALSRYTPPSFEHEYGWVRYEAHVNIDTSCCVEGNTYASFTVINPVDLFLSETIQYNDNQIYIHSSFKMPKTGGFRMFKPIPIEIQSDDQPPIDQIRISLFEHFKFNAKFPEPKVKIVDNLIAEGILENGTVSGQKKMFRGQLKPLRPLDLIDINGSQLIDNSFVLKVQGKYSGGDEWHAYGSVPLKTIPSSSAARSESQESESVLDQLKKALQSATFPNPERYGVERSQPSDHRFSYTDRFRSGIPLPDSELEEIKRVIQSQNILDEIQRSNLSSYADRLESAFEGNRDQSTKASKKEESTSELPPPTYEDAMKQHDTANPNPSAPPKE